SRARPARVGGGMFIHAHEIAVQAIDALYDVDSSVCPGDLDLSAFRAGLLGSEDRTWFESKGLYVSDQTQTSTIFFEGPRSTTIRTDRNQVRARQADRHGMLPHLQHVSGLLDSALTDNV